MTKLPIRLLAVGLGSLSLSGCLIIPPDAMSDHGPGPSPTAKPVQTSSTVRRVAPPPAALAMANPNTPVQYIAVPADQLVFDATGRPMAKADAIPPGFMPVMLPPNTPAPTLAQTPANVPPLASSNDGMEVVAISHTPEPPLALAEQAKIPQVAPRPLPETVNKPAQPPQVNRSEPLPAIINNRPAPKTTSPARAERALAGSQLLVLQQPAGYNPIQTKCTVSDGLPNLLIPPVAPEELKLVSSPRTGCNTGPLPAALKAYQDRLPEDAERQLAQLEPASRDVLRKMLPLAAKLGETGTTSADPTEVAELVDQLHNMVGTLRAKAALRIEK